MEVDSETKCIAKCRLYAIEEAGEAQVVKSVGHDFMSALLKFYMRNHELHLPLRRN